MKKFFRLILYVSVISPVIFLPFIAEPVSLSVENSIKICLETLIPSIFPFLFFSLLISLFMGDMLSEITAPFLMPLFGISKEACRTVIIGLLGGFPSGAADAAQLYEEKKISKSEAERLPFFCNNAGLMFTVGAIGVSTLHSFKAGVIIYIYHLFSSLIAALFTKPLNGPLHFPLNEKSRVFPEAKDFPRAFSLAVFRSIKTLAVICANFTLFKVICDVLCQLFGKSTAVLFLSGLIEVTGGVLSMPKTPEGLIMISLLLSFNGLSVHMQTMSFFAPLKLSVKKLFFCSVFKALLSALLMYVTFSEKLLSGRNFPPMAFYVLAVFIPVMLIVPVLLKKLKASAAR